MRLSMASADFCRFILWPCDHGSTRQTDRSFRVLRTRLHAYARCINNRSFVQVQDFDDIRHLIRSNCLMRISVHQAFDFYRDGFLQIPSRGGPPCRPANTSPCRECNYFGNVFPSPSSECALPGAQKIPYKTRLYGTLYSQ